MMSWNSINFIYKFVCMEVHMKKSEQLGIRYMILTIYQKKKNWQDHVPSTLVVSVSVALVFGQGFCVYQNEVELYQSILYNSLSPSPSLLYYLDQNVPVRINIKLKPIKDWRIDSINYFVHWEMNLKNRTAHFFLWNPNMIYR